MKEWHKGNKAIQVLGGMLFYGQYYKDEFQVLESHYFTPRKLVNLKQKYGFYNI